MHQMKTGWAILVACIGSLAISGCSGAEEDPPGGGGGSKTPVQEKVAPIDGENSFVILSSTDAPQGATAAPAVWSSSCISCHGDAGQGSPILAPEVRHIPADFATYVIRNGRKDSMDMPTGMVAFPADPPAPLGSAVISDADVQAVVAWLNGQPKPTTPEGLYKDFCGNCHGPVSATGGSSGVKLLAGAPGSAIDAAVRNGFGSVPNQRKFYMPKFDTTLLTDAELGLIKQYLGATM